MKKYNHGSFAAKYQIIAFDKECGLDEKEDVCTIKEVKTFIGRYIKEGYEYIYLIDRKSIVLAFDKNNINGRLPYNWENNRFSFAIQHDDDYKQLSLNF